MSTENPFLDENYEVPVSGGGFTKLEPGENRLRILSSPLLMWLEWRDGKPTRHAFKGLDSKPKKGEGQKDSVKHAWGLIVWNYKTESIEVLELDKQDLISTLTNHSKDKDWGHPKNYDVVFTKKGTGMDTSYTMVAKPHTQPGENIYDAYAETPIDLSKLLTGESPFLSNGGSASSTAPAATQSKTVTPENWTKGDAIPEGYEAEGDGIKKKSRPF